MTFGKFRPLIEVNQKCIVQCDNEHCDFAIENKSGDPNEAADYLILGVMSLVKDRMKSARQNLNQELDIDRITYDTNLDNRDLDEVVVRDVNSVHIERMSSDGIWMAIYPKEGTRLVVNLYTTSPGTPDDDDSEGPAIYGHAELGA